MPVNVWALPSAVTVQIYIPMAFKDTVLPLWTGWHHGPLTRYVKLRVAHAPGMPGTFSPPPRINDPDMHHGTCVTHVPWCILASLTCGFLLSRWRGKRSRHSRRMHNPQFYVSGKRPIENDRDLAKSRGTSSMNFLTRIFLSMALTKCGDQGD